MKTTAIPSADGSHYIMNGSKLWISNSKEAGVFLIFANAAPQKGYKGITAFVVDADTPGITVGPKERKMGLKVGCQRELQRMMYSPLTCRSSLHSLQASSTCPLSFEDVKIDASCVLGEVGKGYKYAIEILNEGRIGIAAQQLGIAKGAFNATMPYLRERKQFGQSIGDFQGMQHQVAQLATEIHAVEVMTYNAARMKENGLPSES